MTLEDTDYNQRSNLIWKITEAIADNKGIEPSELDLCLADYINLNAVVKLSDSQNSSWTLTFELPKQDVTVTSDGTILVDGNQEYNWIST